MLLGNICQSMQPHLAVSEKEALIRAEMKSVKQQLFRKRRNGTGKRIGGLPSMKQGRLRVQAEANVLARLSVGVELALLSSSTSSFSSSFSTASSSSSSPAASPLPLPSFTSPMLAETYLSRLILPGALHRGNKVIKFVSMLFKAAPELWSKYSDAAQVSVDFHVAGKSQRTDVYNFMCKSVEAAMPDFLARVGIPDSEAALTTSATAWVALSNLPPSCHVPASRRTRGSSLG